MSGADLKRRAMALAIRDYLTRNGMRQADFAKLLGCDPGIVSRYLSTSSYPQGHLQSILNTLSLSEEEVVRIYRHSIGDDSIDDRLTLLRKFFSFGHQDMIDRINIVTASSGLVSEYKNYKARNYIELDNYSDRDAILQIAIDVSRCYPQSEIKLWKSEEFAEQNFGENIILLGGPSFGKHTNNTVVDTFIKERRIPIHFTDNALVIDGEEYIFEMKADGSVKKDYAVIIRFRNLFIQEKCVVSLMGHFSWGVAAASASLSTRSIENNFVLRQITLSEDTITIFPIMRVLGKALPKLEELRSIRF